jgi:FMN reductase
LNGQTRPFENGLPANEEVAGQLRTVARQVYDFAFAQRLLGEHMDAARPVAAVGT